MVFLLVSSKKSTEMAFKLILKFGKANKNGI